MTPRCCKKHPCPCDFRASHQLFVSKCLVVDDWIPIIWQHSELLNCCFRFWEFSRIFVSSIIWTAAVHITATNIQKRAHCTFMCFCLACADTKISRGYLKPRCLKPRYLKPMTKRWALEPDVNTDCTWRSRSISASQAAAPQGCKAFPRRRLLGHRDHRTTLCM